MYYARLRFIVNLLPQLQRATGLRRVVSVLAGTKEGPVQTDDMQVRRMSVLRARGHAASLTTLALEEAAQRSAATISTSGAGPVSFVHAYPGFVRTPLGRKDVSGATATALVAVNAVLGILGPLIYIPIEESGERHVFLATSARFRAATGGGSSGDGTKEADGETISPSLPADGVPLPAGVAVARGTDGKPGSGAYSVDKDGESAPPKVEQFLERLRKDGTAEKVWADLEEQFVRITGAASV